MPNTYPGTVIETTAILKGSTRALFDGIFAAGGITLSQVSVMTGLEPYLIQNWVKRGFVSSPVKRMYSKEQLSRIIIINMLRESLQIEKICTLIHAIMGIPGDKSDDLISDDELYHLYVDMISVKGIDVMDNASVSALAEKTAEEYTELDAVSRKKLSRILCVMYYAHTASKLRERSNEILFELED